MSKFSGLGGRLYRGETSVEFIGKRRRWYAVSILFILVSIGSLAVQGLHLGIEFKGGSSFTVTTNSPSVEQARSAVQSAGVDGELIVQVIGDDKVRVQTGSLDSQANNAVQDALAASFSVNVATIDTQIIGPSWGEEITRKALYGLFGFLFVIMIYLAMALEPKMAVAAIVAVLHDVFITVGVYALVGFDVTPATVIGFLTILGYSLYDMPVAAILFVGAGLLGAGTLKDLSLALFIGLIVGTYSSIFIAPPILASLREREPAMQALAKRVSARSGGVVSSSAVHGSTTSIIGRGPRNQPKRKGRK